MPRGSRSYAARQLGLLQSRPVNAHADIGPEPMESRAQIYALGRELSQLGQIVMDLSTDGPRQDLHRARRKLAEIKAKLGVRQ